MDASFESSESRQLQLKQHMLLSLDVLTAEIAKSEDFAKDEKVHTLCEGYDMMLRLMDEVKETSET